MRGLSFACAVLHHLEHERFDIHLCRVIADEAIRRKLGEVDEATFARTVDAMVLHAITPAPVERRRRLR